MTRIHRIANRLLAVTGAVVPNAAHDAHYHILPTQRDGPWAEGAYGESVSNLQVLLGQRGHVTPQPVQCQEVNVLTPSAAPLISSGMGNGVSQRGQVLQRSGSSENLKITPTTPTHDQRHDAGRGVHAGLMLPPLAPPVKGGALDERLEPVADYYKVMLVSAE